MITSSLLEQNLQVGFIDSNWKNTYERLDLNASYTNKTHLWIKNPRKTKTQVLVEIYISWKPKTIIEEFWGLIMDIVFLLTLERSIFNAWDAWVFFLLFLWSLASDTQNVYNSKDDHFLSACMHVIISLQC